MKTFLVNSISLYQKIISPLLHQLLGSKTACRSNPSCSAYAQQVITRYGAGRGIVLTMRRLVNCQPYFSL